MADEATYQQQKTLLTPAQARHSHATLPRLSTNSELLSLYHDGVESPMNDDGSSARSTARSPSPSAASEQHVKRRSFSNRYSPDNLQEAYLTGGDRSPQWANAMASAAFGHKQTASGSSSADLGSANIWQARTPSAASTFSALPPGAAMPTLYRHQSSHSDVQTLSDVMSIESIPANENDRARLTKHNDLEYHQYPPSNSKRTRRRTQYGKSATGSFLHTAAQELRRLSLRVVNLTGGDLSAHHRIRLPDEDLDRPVDPATEIFHSRLDRLTGKSLYLFAPSHPIRKGARTFLLWPWTEPIILLLIITNVIVLTIQSAPSVFSHPRPTTPGYFHTWEDWAIFALMLAFTIEMLVRIVVSGFIFGDAPVEKKRTSTFTEKDLDDDLRKVPLSSSNTYKHLTKSGATFIPELPFRHAISRQQATTSGPLAYLRHTYNRMDFVAITSFWISFALAMTGWENRQWLYIFRALSVLRAARLLTLTSGSAVILQSLKKAGPLLVNVAFFVLFAVVLFSIIGIQSFKGSFARSCLWMDPQGLSNYSTSQPCGAFQVNDTTVVSYLMEDGSSSNTPVKGYICPLGQVCIRGENPYNNTESFDNVGLSALQVIIISSANSWATVMYNMMDADYFVSCLFFIVCLIVLNFWLINMFVAVITTTFAIITDETKHSAFGTSVPAALLHPDTNPEQPYKTLYAHELYRRVYQKTKYLWLALIIADVAIQATRSNTMSTQHAIWLLRIEGYFTAVFALEILLRFISYLPDWRNFLKSRSNQTDLFLVLVTSLIQIPVVRNSSVYPWLTVFQLARFYRVVLAIPRIRALLLKLSGSMSGLVNMIIFLFMMAFIATLMSAQFLRGEIPQDIDGESVEMSFYQIYNSFLGVYQVLSSENWTTVLFSATGSARNTFNVFLGAVFFAAWFLFANFIMLRMFIAVINEAFSAGQDEKDKLAQQMARFKMKQRSKASDSQHVHWLSKFNPYLWTKSKSDARSRKSSTIPNSLMLPLRKAVVKEYMTGQSMNARNTSLYPPTSPLMEKGAHGLRVLFQGRKAHVRNKPAAPVSKGQEDFDDIDKHLDLLGARSEQDEEALELANERRALQADFIAAHPSYDLPFWLVPQNAAIRRWAQSCVRPSAGERIFGRPPVPEYVILFDGIVLAAVIASIVVAAVATPVYRQDYFVDRGDLRLTWFNLTEVSLGFVFLIEFLVKVTADGFIFCPNAYLLSIWNGFDFFILLTLIVNIVTALVSGGGVSRLTRALKALRALRLITLIPRIRSTFYEVLILGASKLLDASVLAVLYIIPYAIWGQNIFSGLLYSCNDSAAGNRIQCVGEYLATPAQWEFLAPRAWINPYVWSFDSFRNSFLILFEIISLEGWISVLQSALAITALDEQPQADASQANGIFFVIYILIGGIFILALFISIIIENFTRSSGNALLTAEQKQWIDLKKILFRQKPSRRPKRRPVDGLRAWCFERAVNKDGWWSRTMTVLYVFHIILLMTQTENEPSIYERLRDWGFLLLTFIYSLDIIVRSFGVGWKSFQQNWWNLYDVLVVLGTFATTIPVLLNTNNGTVIQLQKLFLVSIAFKLVQKNSSLNALFKTSVAALPAIFDLFLLWLSLFIVWAIADLEVFSLTRWQAYEGHNANFTTFGKALVMLAFMSVGENWNGFMHDYTVDVPLCSVNDNYLFSDCGSPAWAFALFISWNIISMYIFANMFTGLVVENFAYVTQLYGRVKTLNRDEMRAFKAVWAELDKERTGYLQRRLLAQFFIRLRGAFEVKIYPDEYSVNSLYRDSASTYTVDGQKSHVCSNSMNLAALNKKLNTMNVTQIARRRQMYNRLFREALLTADREKGISFRNMLLMLAHYKLRRDDKAMQVEEMIARQAKMHRVDDLVALDKVRSLLSMVHYRKQFLAHLNSVRLGKKDVPAITIEASDTPHLKGEEMTPSPTSPSLPGSPTYTSRALSPVSIHSDRFGLGFGLDDSAPSSPTRTASPINSSPLHDAQILDELSTSVWARLAAQKATNDDDD